MDSLKDNENISNLLPYDFVKENDVLAFKENNEIKVVSPNNLSINLYQEIQRFLKSDFIFLLLSLFLCMPFYQKVLKIKMVLLLDLKIIKVISKIAH